MYRKPEKPKSKRCPICHAPILTWKIPKNMRRKGQHSSWQKCRDCDYVEPEVYEVE